MMGIYKIISTKFKNFYIGSSINIKKRFNRHLQQLKNQNHSNLNLQLLYNENGIDDLTVEILEIINDRNDLKKIEQWYLDNLNPTLNINLNASGGDMISNHPNKSEIRKKQIEGTRKVAQSESLRLKRSINAKILYPDGPMKNRSHKIESKQKVKEKNGTKILIDGIFYFSFRDAEAKTGISRRKLSKSIKEGKNSNWKLL